MRTGLPGGPARFDPRAMAIVRYPIAAAGAASPPADRGAVDELQQQAVAAHLDEAAVAARGVVDAPPVLIEYADFRCKYCALFATDTLPTLVDPAARAAGQQGLFRA